METHFFNAVNIPRENCHIPQSTAIAHEEFCERYEEAIVDAGGIDIQVLGIGKDGHIGVNEPSSSLGSRTRIKTLAQSTLEANAPHFGGRIDAVAKNGDYNGCRHHYGGKTVLVVGKWEKRRRQRLLTPSEVPDYSGSAGIRATDASAHNCSH